jgi:hypothetical protein
VTPGAIDTRRRTSKPIGAGRLVLLLDEDPTHTAAGSRRLAGRSGTELIWLLNRATRFNPIDLPRRHGKDEVGAIK